MQQAKRTVMRRATAITLVGALFGTTAALFANNVLAQSFPSRPVRVIVPYGPGTGLDVIVRLINEPIGKELKQPVVVENRLGAGGVVGTQAVAISPPDGLTLVAVPSSHTTVSLVTKSVPFHPANDFAGITTLAENPLVLVVARSKNILSVAELVAAAKAKPGALTFASAGTGTSTHISSEKVRIAGGFEALHVPFKTTTDALNEVMAGRVDFTYTSLVAAMPGIQGGKLTPLAMSSRRTPLLPNVPSIEEAGMANSAYGSWLGFLAPAKTTREVVRILYDATAKVLNSAETKERFLKIGTEPFVTSPEDFDKLIRSDLASNERVIKAIGLKLE